MSLIIFVVFSLAEVGRHLYIRKINKRSPNKVLSFVLRSVVGGLFILLEFWAGYPLEYAIPTYIITNWWIHDYLQNILIGKKPVWYLNSIGPIDQFQNKYPNAYVWFIFKTIALIGLVGMYYFN